MSSNCSFNRWQIADISGRRRIKECIYLVVFSRFVTIFQQVFYTSCFRQNNLCSYSVINKFLIENFYKPAYFSIVVWAAFLVAITPVPLGFIYRTDVV